MKIFKNRGDIYISKTDIKDDLERKVLLIILAIIVVITSVVLIFVGAKNDFSVKKFFKPEDTEVTVTIVEDGDTTEQLPTVSGKNNFLFIVTNNDGTEMFLSSIIQIDMDSVSYKVCNILPETIIDGTSINRIFTEGGTKNAVLAIDEGLSINVDYYITMTVDKLSDFYDEMGTVAYPIIDDIKFKSNIENSDDNYSIKMKAGEQKLSGKEAVSLLRYYISEKKDVNTANDIVLNSFLQLINSENFLKSDDIFKFFISSASTNVTVRDFSNSTDAFVVLSNDNTGANVYNVVAKYTDGKITESSLSSIKRYFSE